ncbi:MAG: Gfo/Idh/MocA family oxidoreductase [Planctomycetota bacterium]|jgi:predicted dehydrogenase|nr:Gfo/Idh/MocA family oxidoreductase [Planctomycetota bacterium]
MSISIAYVGCGYMAQRVHLPNICDLSDRCHLAAIAETRPHLREQVCNSFTVSKRYAHHSEIAEDDSIDAVAISGHFAMQGEIAADMLRAGKHVFVEKPLGISAAQCEAIIAAEQASRKTLMVGYMKRYDAGNHLLRKTLRDWRASGDYGLPTFMRNHGFCGTWDAAVDRPFITSEEAPPEIPTALPFPSWLPESHHGSYLDYIQQYTHNVNLMRWLLDADDDWEVLHTHLDDHGCGGVALLRIGGIRASLESGSLAYHAWDEHTQIYFEGGWLKTDAPPLLLRNVSATVEYYDGREGHRGSGSLIPDNSWTWSYREEMRAFLDMIEHGTKPESSASDTLQDMRMLEAIYRDHCRRIGVEVTA